MLYDFLEIICKIKFHLPLALLLSPPENRRMKDCFIQAMIIQLKHTDCTLNIQVYARQNIINMSYILNKKYGQVKIVK